MARPRRAEAAARPDPEVRAVTVRTVTISPSLAVYVDGGRRKLAGERRCRMCLRERRRSGVRQLTRHHLVPQAWYRLNGLPVRIRDAEANIVPLCANCHRAVETDEWARRMLRKVLDQTEIAYVIQVRGKLWFDRTYPAMPSGGELRAKSAHAA